MASSGMFDCDVWIALWQTNIAMENHLFDCDVWIALWQTNIAMENHHFQWVNPL